MSMAGLLTADFRFDTFLVFLVLDFFLDLALVLPAVFLVDFAFDWGDIQPSSSATARGDFLDDAVVFLAALDLTGKSMDILGLEDANSLRPCGPRTRYTIVA